MENYSAIEKNKLMIDTTIWVILSALCYMKKASMKEDTEYTQYDSTSVKFKNRQK